MTQVSRQATAPPTATPTATLTRVALNGKWLAQRRTGTQRFAEGAVGYEEDPDHSLNSIRRGPAGKSE